MEHSTGDTGGILDQQTWVSQAVAFTALCSSCVILVFHSPQTTAIYFSICRETFGYLKHAWNVTGRPQKKTNLWWVSSLQKKTLLPTTSSTTRTDPNTRQILESMRTGAINIKQAAEALGMEPAMLAYQLAGKVGPWRWFFVCLYVCLFVCLFVCMFVCLFVCLEPVMLAYQLAGKVGPWRGSSFTLSLTFPFSGHQREFGPDQDGR